LLIALPLLTGCEKTENKETLNQNPPINVSENPQNSCETACANYVDKCLTLVPGATQQLYVDGQNSCLKECSTWDIEKTECIKKSQNCTWMTEGCKL
jgi:hypothetical protein